jgi:E3 ubiquitin-protein ligase UBR2
VHRDVISHQLVALNLMTWLNEMVEKSDGLRRLLSMLCTSQINGRPETIINQVILIDAALWKVARASFHQLFMNAILMDDIGKVQFSITFAKNYKQLMHDFIQDDHEHSISVSSFSVQIFTVPTIAHMLVYDHNILYEVLNTFWCDLQPEISKDGSIDFHKREMSYKKHMKRIYMILTDLKYRLHNRRSSWKPQLRE